MIWYEIAREQWQKGFFSPINNLKEIARLGLLKANATKWKRGLLTSFGIVKKLGGSRDIFGLTFRVDAESVFGLI